MQQSPSKADGSSVDQEVYDIYWSRKLRYRFHDSPHLNLTLRHLNSLNIRTLTATNIVFTVLLPSRLSSIKLRLPLTYFNCNVYQDQSLLYMLHVPPILFCLISLILFCEKKNKLLSSCTHFSAPSCRLLS